MSNGMTEEMFFSNLELDLKTRSEKKRMEYIKNLKEKRNGKKKDKRKNKNKIEEQQEKVKNENNKEVLVNDINDFIKEENIEIEYVDEDPNSKSKIFEEFKSVFDYFKIPKKDKKSDYDEEDNEIVNKPIQNIVNTEHNDTLGKNFFT